MKRNKKIGVALVMLSLALGVFTSANALKLVEVRRSAKEIEPPLGLTWGANMAELEEKGMRFYGCDNDGDLMVCRAENPPKSISFANNYYLIFDLGKGLHKVAINGRIGGNNYLTGGTSRDLYRQVVTSLTRKYGNGSLSSEDRDSSSNICLVSVVNKCHWTGNFGGTVRVEFGNQLITITYQSKAWLQIRIDNKEAKKIDGDEDAL